MAWWEWKDVREHYARYLEAARATGETQESVARAGGLSGNNAISKLLSNENLGPTVETFLRALNGVGLTPSQFFAQLEHESPPPPGTAPSLATVPPPSVPSEDNATRSKNREIVSVVRRLAALLFDEPAPGRRRRR